MSLREALIELERGALDIVSRFERLGMPRDTSGRAKHEDRLARLNDGRSVTVEGWRLGAALDQIGAPLAEVRAALAGPEYWTVDPDGSLAERSMR